MPRKKQYIKTRVKGDVFVVTREEYITDMDMDVADGICATQIFTVFQGTWDECQSYVSWLANEETEEFVVYRFEKTQLVVPIRKRKDRR